MDPSGASGRKKRVLMPGLLFMAAGLAIFSWGAYGVQAGWKNESWPWVPGTVVQAEVRKSQKVSYPYVAYRYSVDGREYQNDTLRVGPKYGTMGDSPAKVVSRFRTLKGVRVHYDPGNPESSVLLPGIGGDVLLLVLVGAMFFSAGLHAYLYMNRGPRSAASVEGPASKDPLMDPRPPEDAGKSPWYGIPGLSAFVLFLLAMSLAVPGVFRILVEHDVISTMDSVISSRDSRGPEEVRGSPAGDPYRMARSEADRRNARRKEKELYKTLKSLKNQALPFMRSGRHAEAEPLLRERLELARQAGDSIARHLPSYINDVAYVAREQGRLEEAEALYDESLSLSRASPREKDLSVAVACEGLAKIRMAQGRLSGVEELYDEAMEIWDQVRGAGNANTIGIMRRKAVLYEKQGRTEEARALKETANRMYKALLAK